MKILILNYADAGGGASSAAYRLAHALHNAGHQVTLGVLQKKTASPIVQEFVFKRKFFQKIDKRIQIYRDSFLRKYFKSTNRITHSTDFYSKLNIEEINKSGYDFVHIHWINNNMISVRDIARITKPIVWTMHDSWVFCGAEHHPNILEKDERFMAGYTKQNKPDTTQGFDICKIVYDLKKRYLQRLPIHFIAPSRWEHDCLKKSALFRTHECTVIPNIIDRDIFFSVKNKILLKKIFNIPLNKKIIGFGAAYDVDDPLSLKGGLYLIEALKKICDPENYYLIIFGSANERLTESITVSAFYTGYIASSVILATIYNCCDVFVCPSVIENLPYTCLEAICCGVPVAAFNTGGIPDIIEHKYNGYLAEPFDSEDLYKGIMYILDNVKELSKNCIKKADNDFDMQAAVKKHIALYQQVLIDSI